MRTRRERRQERAPVLSLQCCGRSARVSVASPLDLAIGGVNQLGRSFRVVGVLPGVTLILLLYSLIAGTGSDGRLDLQAVAKALSSITLARLGLLAFAAVLVGLILQPLQFVSVQLLEGYWGIGRFAEPARLRRIDQYVAKRLELIDREDGLELMAAAVRGGEEVPLMAKRDEASRLRARFPEDPNRVMPTRLGNVLRRHEDLAGSQYGLNSLLVVPHLALISPKAHLDYLDDRRNELDAAVRFCVVWSVSAAVTLALLWRGGLWALASLPPFGLAWMSYRGAVESASHYGSALSVLIDLNRFRLYEELNLPTPNNTDDERRQNATLMKLLDHEATVSLQYGSKPERKLIVPDKL